MISDIQLIAQILKKVRAGDQVTQVEEGRLDMIAIKGFSEEPLFPVPRMDFATNPEGHTEAELERHARLTRERQ